MSAPVVTPRVLDDPGALRAADPGGMLDAIATLGSQLRDGFEASRSTPSLPSAEGLRVVVVCGMGGSGVAGDVLRAAFGTRLSVPVVVVKGYSLPAFCAGDALVIACSFSGNTEETLAAYAEAVARGSRVVAVASGGELASLAEADNTPFVRLTDPARMPRAALGSIAAAPLGVLEAMGLLPDAQDEVRATADLLHRMVGDLGPERPTGTNEAKSVAGWVGDRVPVLWGTEGPAEAAALRWKTQFNENAKVPAFSSTLPELGHNEVEGWSAGMGERFAVLVLRAPGEPPRVGMRLDATVEALGASGLAFRQVRGPEGPLLAALFGLILIGDFASTYLALARGVDPSPVPVLTSLKERLAETRFRWTGPPGGRGALGV